MTCWFQEASALSRNINLDGESTESCDRFLKIVQENCNTEEDYKFLASSSILECVLTLYRAEYGNVLSVLSGVIGKSGSLARKEVGLTFLLKVIPGIKKSDQLYKKCRRVFIRAKPVLSDGGISKAVFLDFFKEIIDEVQTGVSRFLDTDSLWPNLSSITLYVSFLERTPHAFIPDLSLHHKFICLVSVVDNLLMDKSVKHDLSIYVNLLKVLTRLEKVICGKETRLEKIVSQRTDTIIDWAILSIESNKFSEVVETWMQENNLFLPLFASLLGKLESLFHLVNTELLTPPSVFTFSNVVQTVKHMSKAIEGGEMTVENLFEGRREELYVMGIVKHIVDHGHCPDETLLGVDRLVQKADSALKKLLALSLIPKIRDGMSFEISVSRKSLLKDSRDCLLKATSENLSCNLFVKFKEEEGIGTGVMKEWLYLTTQMFLDPELKYFSRETSDRGKLSPTLDPVNDLQFYNFFGRLMALALVHHVQLGVTLDPIILLMLADLEVNLEDVKQSDPTLYKNMNQEIEFNLGSVLQDTEEARLTRDRLRAEYSKTVVDENIIQLLDEKVDGIKQGFDCVFGTSLRRKLFFQTIEPSHLEMVIRGEPKDISVQEWEQHTDHNKEDQPYIHSFWQIVREFSAEQRRDLLFFWMAIRYLPPGGFCNLAVRPAIKVTKDDCYPHASTCINTLRIPPATYQVLEYRLHVSIQHPSSYELL
ncbi:hypothetical protein POM88_045891 [Heracleum sosnowskyi]|uniref:HECT-type E3 ubiquitin transferase n=1 Tax=Heracleum sosnowskyi TaxID=360622 RepID=A0AAD8H5B8_9APIA|nr:hypothetical protein POM88_045891 [Heracleum sosnowskyi]